MAYVRLTEQVLLPAGMVQVLAADTAIPVATIEASRRLVAFTIVFLQAGRAWRLRQPLVMLVRGKPVAAHFIQRVILKIPQVRIATTFVFRNLGVFG